MASSSLLKTLSSLLLTRFFPCLLMFLYFPSFTFTKETERQEEREAATESLGVLLLLTMLILVMLIAYMLRELKSRYFHETGLSIVFGCLMGLLIKVSTNGQETLKEMMKFDPSMFFLFLLPPIIFESGFSMKKLHFFNNIDSIIVFAFFGTFISAVVFGVIVFVAGKLGMGWSLSLLECMMFGSLISATDPVTVLAILKELHVDVDLYASVFGESVLNDAVSIVLYRTMLSIGETEFSVVIIFKSLGTFCGVFLGSLSIGSFVALFSALLLKHQELYKYPMIELSMIALFAYSSYLLADGLGMSGIVSILFCGIVMAQYTYGNLSADSKKVATFVFGFMAYLSETFIFVYLGLAIASFDSEIKFNPLLIIVSLVASLLSRALNVFPLSYVLNYFRPSWKQIPMKHQILIWFSGLRGAIAFALSLRMSSLDIPTINGHSILTTTLILVLITVVFLGGSTTSLLERLDIKVNDTDSDAASQLDHQNFWVRMDQKYMRPIFSRRVARSRIKPDDLGAIELRSLEDNAPGQHASGGSARQVDEDSDLPTQSLHGRERGDIQMDSSPHRERRRSSRSPSQEFSDTSLGDLK